MLEILLQYVKKWRVGKKDYGSDGRKTVSTLGRKTPHMCESCQMLLRPCMPKYIWIICSFLFLQKDCVFFLRKLPQPEMHLNKIIYPKKSNFRCFAFHKKTFLAQMATWNWSLLKETLVQLSFIYLLMICLKPQYMETPLVSRLTSRKWLLAAS